jgi:ubiquinone/menaquinone biosynthesis C-methylase UbiE
MLSGNMNDYNYDKISVAENYDVLELAGNITALNKKLDRILKRFKAKTVWDATCGTGAQSIYLHKKGYKVTASDYSKEMLALARKKCPALAFKQADIRKARLGKFDAVISIFNAIGHLSKKDFEKALKNIHKNLNEGGIYIFDIFNLDYMRSNFISHEFLDCVKETNNVKYVRFNNNRLNMNTGLMTINQKTYTQNGKEKPVITKDKWDMQIYSSSQLTEILKRNGFEIIKFSNFYGNKFDNKQNSSILTIAKRVN